jgi:glycine/D-amino acid oxidase-like deaminating enzyme
MKPDSVSQWDQPYHHCFYTMPESRPIIVLGAGVIGLTTAIRLLDSPLCTIHHHPIHIIADHMPSDPLDVRYASTLAGAHHLSFADDGDERNRRWDRTSWSRIPLQKMTIELMSMSSVPSDV